MSSAVNTALAPIGIRPFSGGPYPDAGLGDKALQASAPLQTAGQNMLTQAGTALPNIWKQWADVSGLDNPLTPNTATGFAAPSGYNAQGAALYAPGTDFAKIAPTGQEGTKPGGAPNPYNLSPIHTADYNKRASAINQARKQAIQDWQANQSARGLSRSGLQAGIQHINDLADAHLSSTLNDIIQGAHKEKTDALAQAFAIIQNMFGQGAGAIQGNVGTLQREGQNATQRTQQGQAALGSVLGPAIGAAIGVPGARKPATPAQMGGAGADIIGGIGGAGGGFNIPQPGSTWGIDPWTGRPSWIAPGAPVPGQGSPGALGGYPSDLTGQFGAGPAGFDWSAMLENY